MSAMILDEEDLEKLKARLNRVCDELHELGASCVLVMVSVQQKNEEDVVIGHNRLHRRDGNFFETLGLLEAVRVGLHQDAAPID